MSSTVLVSKSPLIFGRFEWDIEIPPLIQNELVTIEDKRLQIDGQDGNTYTICFIIPKWGYHPILPDFSFWTYEPIKGNVQIEMKIWTKNAKSELFFHQNRSYRGLDRHDCHICQKVNLRAIDL